MADEQDFEDRSEDASPQRLRQARERGEVVRSRELTTAAVMSAGAASLLFLGAGLATQMRDGMQAALRIAAVDPLDVDIVQRFAERSMDVFGVVLPVLLATFLAAMTAPMLLGGWNLSLQALQPDFSRLDPIKGFARVFSTQGFLELLKSLLKFVTVALVAVLLLWQWRHEWLGLGLEPTASGIAHAGRLCLWGLLWMSLVLVLIAAIDVPYQLWSYHRRLRMTREELKREHRENEGRPEVRAQIRRMQQEAARHRMMEAVPQADVVVVNPTHFAVALKYDDKRMRAPRVVAKGVDLVAAAIRERATDSRVPILSAPPLARVLYRSVDIGEEIPAVLYAAVAEVLTWVFQLRRHREGALPTPPTIRLPDGLEAQSAGEPV